MHIQVYIGETATGVHGLKLASKAYIYRSALGYIVRSRTNKRQKLPENKVRELCQNGLIVTHRANRRKKNNKKDGCDSKNATGNDKDGIIGSMDFNTELTAWMPPLDGFRTPLARVFAIY